MSESDDSDGDGPGEARQPLSAAARRVLGVLVEKAKTTPDNYPLTVNAIIAGSNQKSNRSPQMSLDEGDALDALDELRGRGAVREVQGSGRAIKYRHAAYEWFDIDGPQSALITEMLLRGPQTLGELRTRASRMHPFADLSAVEEVIRPLIEKGLVESVSPAGRGQLFTHTLYPPAEKPRLAGQIEKQLGQADADAGAAAVPPAAAGNRDEVDRLLARLDQVNERIDQLEQRIADLENPS